MAEALDLRGQLEFRTRLVQPARKRFTESIGMYRRMLEKDSDSLDVAKILRVSIHVSSIDHDFEAAERFSSENLKMLH